MALLHCNTCGGRYVDVQADGTTYFHTCPPLVRHKIRLADGAIVVVDNRENITTLRSADGTVKIEQSFDPPLPIGAVWLSAVTVTRDGHRDENPPSTREADSGRLKHEGTGRTVLAGELGVYSPADVDAGRF